MVMLAAAMAAATPLVTVEDIVATRDISGVTISPDGRWAAYRVSEPSVAENRVALGWHIVGVNGGDHRRVADGGAARFSFAGTLIENAPIWDADSKGFHFLAMQDGAVGVWLRRTPRYRRLWAARDRLPIDAPIRVGLLAWIDPAISAPEARPIWSPDVDPKVLQTRAGRRAPGPGDNFDVLALADYVSISVDQANREHWLISDGRWLIRLMHHDGTLLGRSTLLVHEIEGVDSAAPKIAALQQFLALTARGEMPASLRPRESRAARWILELRTADALAAGASQKRIAEVLFGESVTARRWRIESASYRSRVQRLVKAAQQYLADPFSGPWFR